MNIDIKSLVNLANSLDEKGFSKEADMCDKIISKYAEDSTLDQSGTPPTYFIQAINQFKKASFVLDLRSGRTLSDKEWQEGDISDKTKYHVLLEAYGPEAFFADKNKSYKIKNQQGGWIFPGTAAENYAAIDKAKENNSNEVPEPQCESTEKYVLLQVIGYHKNPFTLKLMNSRKINGRSIPVILKMKGNRFVALYKGFGTGMSEYGKIKEKIESEQLVMIEYLPTRIDHCGAVSSMVEFQGAQTKVNKESELSSVDASSSGKKVACSNGKVFYYDGKDVTCTTSFAELGDNVALTANDKSVLKNFFNNPNKQNSIGKYTAFNNVAESIKTYSQSQSDDGFFASEDKIAADFIRRLREIRKFSGDAGDIVFVGFKIEGFDTGDVNNFSWDSRGDTTVYGIDAQGTEYEVATISKNRITENNTNEIPEDVKNKIANAIG